ncbi:MAG TPA: hypothetical protein PKA53_11075, partial [Sphingobacterium sp.]|nr:hypothetical protein [Sphingobacterium sp.]
MRLLCSTLFFVLSILLFIQCKKTVNEQEDLDILTIALLAEDNSEILANDFQAQAQHGGFTLELPESLKGEEVFLHITHTGSTLLVAGQESTTQK